MTDNEKMREVWDAHDRARNKAWREEPGTFDTLDAFKAGAGWQAAKSVPKLPTDAAYRWLVDHGVEPESTVHKLGKRLAELLDEEQFAECEALLLKVLHSQTAPVVGDALFYVSDSTPTAESQIQYDVCAYQKDYSFFPVYRAPATSITEAELERLRKDAERYAVVRDSTYCDVYMHEIYLTDDDLDAAIDEAIAGGRDA